MHNWWPIAAFLSLVLALKSCSRAASSRTGSTRPTTCSPPRSYFPIAFFLAAIFWAARDARKHANAWVTGVMVGLAFFVVALGNLCVVWAIGGGNEVDPNSFRLGGWAVGFSRGDLPKLR
jgi:hypothetical protein